MAVERHAILAMAAAPGGSTPLISPRHIVHVAALVEGWQNCFRHCMLLTNTRIEKIWGRKNGQKIDNDHPQDIDPPCFHYWVVNPQEMTVEFYYEGESQDGSAGARTARTRADPECFARTRCLIGVRAQFLRLVHVDTVQDLFRFMSAENG